MKGLLPGILQNFALPFRHGQQEAAAFAGHSLRAGFVTSAVKRGANLLKITDVTGHRSLEMLKGTKPADLQVMQSTKFELVINLPTARCLSARASR